MGITYLKFDLPDALTKVIKFPEELRRLEVDPLPLDSDHLRKIIVNNKSSLTTVLECEDEEIGRIKADPRPVLNVSPDIIAEVTDVLEVLEIMVERPKGLIKSREFEKAMGTERLKSESLKKALGKVGLGNLNVKSTTITLVAPYFTIPQQSAALRFGYKLKCIILARDVVNNELYLLIGNPNDPFPTVENKEEIDARKKLMNLVHQEVKNFLSATEWVVKDLDGLKVELYLPLPIKYEPVRVIIRPVITVPNSPEASIVVELKIKNGTKVITAKNINLPWQNPKPIKTEWGRVWWTHVPIVPNNDEYTISKLLFPLREIHDSLEAVRVD